MCPFCPSPRQHCSITLRNNRVACTSNAIARFMVGVGSVDFEMASSLGCESHESKTLSASLKCPPRASRTSLHCSSSPGNLRILHSMARLFTQETTGEPLRSHHLN